MTDVILLGIDGTGELAEGDYKRSMKSSFVNYIVKHSPASVKQYLRGPAFDGLDMFAIARMGHAFVHLQRVAHPEAKVLLTGYSRGGAGVIGVAQLLQRDGVNVDGMMLFDPVDRSPTSDADEVPNNVLQLCIARRLYDTFSRVSFNNCANIWHAPTVCQKHAFWATHGGMGGVPWKPVDGHPDNEFVSEGVDELALMQVVYDVVGVSWVPEPGDKRSAREFLTQRIVAGNHTRVTYHDDAAGAHSVWQWAEPWLRREGFLAPS